VPTSDHTRDNTECSWPSRLLACVTSRLLFLLSPFEARGLNCSWILESSQDANNTSVPHQRHTLLTSCPDSVLRRRLYCRYGVPVTASVDEVTSSDTLQTGATFKGKKDSESWSVLLVRIKLHAAAGSAKAKLTRIRMGQRATQTGRGARRWIFI